MGARGTIRRKKKPTFGPVPAPIKPKQVFVGSRLPAGVLQAGWRSFSASGLRYFFLNIGERGVYQFQVLPGILTTAPGQAGEPFPWPPDAGDSALFHGILPPKVQKKSFE